MVISNKLHGTKREGQYNLNYSRFDGVGEESREEASREGREKAVIEGHVPPELKEALRLMKSGDPKAKKRANELALLAVERGGPEIRKRFEEALALSTDTTAQDGSIKAASSILEEKLDAAREELKAIDEKIGAARRCTTSEDFFELLKESGIQDEGEIQRAIGDPQFFSELINRRTLPKEDPKVAKILNLVEQCTESQEVAETVPTREKTIEAAWQQADHTVQYLTDENTGKMSGACITVDVSGIKSIEDVELDVSKCYIRIRASPIRKVLNLGPFNFELNIDTVEAKLKRKHGKLLVTEKVSGPDPRHEGPSSHRGVAVKMHFGEEAELDWGRKLYPFYVEVTSVDLSGYARSAKLLGEEGDKASKFLENWRKYATDRERSKKKQESLTAQLSGLVAESRASPGEDIMHRRWELRRQRDEEERKMLDITQLLYASWMQLKLMREWQGFTSTPWILKAVPATMDPADDEERCSRERQEESQEVSVLQSLPLAEAIAAVSERWAKTKRQPGEPQYDMRLIYDDQCITADHKLDSPLEIERRERARKIRAYLTASLDGGTEVRSEFELPLTDIYTWSLGELPLGDAVHCQRAASDPPLVAAAGAFSFAVHTMPNLLTLRVYVSHIESRWQLLVPRSLRLAMGRTRVAAEAVVNVKTTVGGKQVTHVYRQHHFAENLTVLADGAKEDSEHSGITTGVLTWPDAATSNHSGYVVPPIIGSGGTVHDEEPKDVETMSNTPRGADDSTAGVLQGDLAEYFEKRYCWLPLAAGEGGSAMWRSARLMMLRERAEGRLLGEYGNAPIPAFDRELPAHLRRRSTQDTDEHQISRAKTP
ncbi:hypothetical protein FOZ63_032779, partial [Perkinsus olseni]